MQTKLTLRLDDELVAHAKRHARENGQSLSRVVARYFMAITASDHAPRDFQPTPTVAKLWGSLEGAYVDMADYHAHLERKHS